MIDLTYIWRLSDQLPLVGLDRDQNSSHLEQRSALVKNLSQHSSHQFFTNQYSRSQQGPERRYISLQQGNKKRFQSQELGFHVLLDQGIGLIALSDIGNELSQLFLDELKREFLMQFSNDIDQVEHPFSFVAFERFIENTSQIYEEKTTKYNIEKLRDEITDVQSIIKQNIEEVIGRGDKLRDMTKKSDVLRESANRLKSSAVEANRMYLWKTYGPVVVTILIVIFVFILYRYVFRY